MDTQGYTVWGMGGDELLHLAGMFFLGALHVDEAAELFEQREHGARGYRQLYLADGLAIYADPVHGGGHAHIELRGELMKAQRPADLRAFWLELERRSTRWHATRSDAAWNGCPFTPGDIYDSAIAGNLRCACRRRPGWLRDFHSHAGDTSDWLPGDEKALCGRTVYLGRRASQRMVRCYDGRGYTRLELELHDDRATMLVRDLMQADPASWSRIALAHLLDFVTFCDKDSDSNISRAADHPLPWWADFIGSAVRACCRIRRVVTTNVERFVKRSERAVRQVARFALVFGAHVAADALDVADGLCRELDGRILRAVRAAIDKHGDAGDLSPPETSPRSWLFEMTQLRIA